MFAEVAFPISNFKTFTYEIPEKLISEIHIGSRVVAPFRKKQIEGIIVNIFKRHFLYYVYINKLSGAIIIYR